MRAASTAQRAPSATTRCGCTSRPSTPRPMAATVGPGPGRNCWPGASGWARSVCTSSCSCTASEQAGRPDLPQRHRQPIRQPGLPGRADAVRVHGLDEPTRKLLGQRLQRDAVRVVEGGAAARSTLRDVVPGQGRSYRLAALVQPNPTALDAGLPRPVRFEQDWLAAQAMQVNMGYGFQGQGHASADDARGSMGKRDIEPAGLTGSWPLVNSSFRHQSRSIGAK